MCVFIRMSHEKLKNKKCLALISKFVSYKISCFLGKACLFVMRGGFLFAGTYCSTSFESHELKESRFTEYVILSHCFFVFVFSLYKSTWKCHAILTMELVASCQYERASRVTFCRTFILFISLFLKLAGLNFTQILQTFT